MSDENFCISITVGVAGTDPIQRQYEVPRSTGFGYKVNEAPTPDCFRMFWGRKTVMVPLRNLILVEMDL